MNVPVITQISVSLVNHMYVSTYQLVGQRVVVGMHMQCHIEFMLDIWPSTIWPMRIAVLITTAEAFDNIFYSCYCKKEHIIMHVYTPVIGMAHKQAFWLCNVICIISNNCF